MTELARYDDWEARLSTYLDRVREEPFKWGSHDCALFAADCVKAQTGIDPAEAFRDQYSTQHGAAMALREYGAGTLLKTMKAWFGEPISVHFAKRGDLVMLNATTTGVCVGRYSYFVGREQGVEGLTIQATASCRYAFRVPFEASA